MVSISDLSTTGRRGQPIYGTAAMLRRMFQRDETEVEPYDEKAAYQKYISLLYELGYRSKDEDDDIFE